jgi:hypothetical protein
LGAIGELANRGEPVARCEGPKGEQAAHLLDHLSVKRNRAAGVEA